MGSENVQYCIYADKSDPCKTLLDWLAQCYTKSCVLTKILELVMLSISVSGSAELAGCAYEATDDFTIFFPEIFS